MSRCFNNILTLVHNVLNFFPQTIVAYTQKIILVLTDGIMNHGMHYESPSVQTIFITLTQQ